MPNTGPSDKITQPVLDILRQRGEVGATGKELVVLTARYNDVLVKLRGLGYCITSSLAHLPHPNEGVKRYVLTAEPAPATQLEEVTHG